MREGINPHISCAILAKISLHKQGRDFLPGTCPVQIIRGLDLAYDNRNKPNPDARESIHFYTSQALASTYNTIAFRLLFHAKTIRVMMVFNEKVSGPVV